jgi:hypothetical protein
MYLAGLTIGQKNCDYAELIANSQKEIEENKLEKFKKYLSRR